MDNYRTDWRNVGAWARLRPFPNCGIGTPWGNLIVKPWGDRLFSERCTKDRPHFKLFGLCISWVRLRHFQDFTALVAETVADLPPPKDAANGSSQTRGRKSPPHPGRKDRMSD